MQSNQSNESKKLKNMFKEFKITPTNELFTQIVHQAQLVIDSPPPKSKQVSFGAGAESAFKPHYTDTQVVIYSKFKELLIAIDTLKKSKYHLSVHERTQFSEWLNDHDVIIRRMHKLPIAIRAMNKQQCDQMIQRIQKYHDKLMEKTNALKMECGKLEFDFQQAHSHAIGIYNQYQADQYRTDSSGIRNFECSLDNLKNMLNRRLKYQPHLIEKTLKYLHKLSGIHSATASVHWPSDKLVQEVKNVMKAFEECSSDEYHNLFIKYEDKMSYLVDLHNDIVRWLNTVRPSFTLQIIYQ